MRQIRNREIAQRSHPYGLMAAAFCFVFLALSVSAASNGIFPGLGGAPPKPEAPKSPQDLRERAASGYQTIVLWPIEKKEKVIPAPHLKVDSLASGEAKQWVIPFYGPYWYFKFAGESPGPNARTTKGDPLKVNVYSTDRAPLLMEAHQQLDEAIDMDCCREMQVVFRNDVSLGAMGVGISLTDSSSPMKRPQMLGVKFIDPNLLEYGQSNATPVEETLTYLFPKHATIKKFDEITVMLLPDAKHATAGRKVAVERFVIVPN
jgi:hypothetical protein